MRVATALLAILLSANALPAQAADEPTFRLVLKDRTFEPARLEVPANKRIILVVRNAEPAAAEFESSGLGVEKIISAGREATIKVGPLKPGEYTFENEFNKAATGTLVAVAE